MKRFPIIAMVMAMCLVILSSQVFCEQITPLSRKASQLRMGMSRQAVINLLGTATWAIIPADKGDWALPDPRIKLELYWRNKPCSPVVVSFGQDYKSTGWDEGRGRCGDIAKMFEPSEDYLCNRPDRAKFCE